MPYSSDDKHLGKNKKPYDTGSKAARKYKLRKKSLQDIPKSRKQNLRDKGFRKSTQRSNRTQDAREILAKKHGIKKAMARVDNKYVLDHEQINDLMDRMGFKFNDVRGVWSSSTRDIAQPDEPEKKKDTSFNPEQGEEALDDIDGTKEKAHDLSQVEDPDISFKDFFFNQEDEDLEDFDDVDDMEDEDWYRSDFVIGKDEEIFHITEREVMIFQGRFLLGLIWEEYDYSEYKINEAGEIWGVMSRRDTIRAMKALELEWDEFNDVWVDSEGVEVFRFRTEHSELKKTVIGRALLANMNFLEYIQFDSETGKPKVHAESVDDKMAEQDFKWNNSEEIWEYVGTDHRADYGSLGHKRGQETKANEEIDYENI